MKKRSLITLELHAGFWACYLILIGVIMGAIYGSRGGVEDAQMERTFITLLAFALVPSTITFYSFHFLIFPRLVKAKSHFFTILYSIGISLVAGCVGFILLYNMYGDNCISGNPDEESEPISLTLFIAFISFISGVIALVIKGFITWLEEIKLKEQLQQKNHEMEMALVKSQLDPHFLFNTINNIDVLIIRDAEEASTYLNKLSDIMRFMLFETKTDEIKLSKEIEYIQKYIELQRIRTANLDYVNFSLKGNSKGHSIAPMVFIPFIENAFKHTTNKKLKEAITICIKVEEKRTILECVNKIDPDRKLQQESNGLGNELIKKRLQLIYPDRHELIMKKEKHLYSVHLTIHHGKA